MGEVVRHIYFVPCEHSFAFKLLYRSNVFVSLYVVVKSINNFTSSPVSGEQSASFFPRSVFKVNSFDRKSVFTMSRWRGLKLNKASRRAFPP